MTQFRSSMMSNAKAEQDDSPEIFRDVSQGPKD